MPCLLRGVESMPTEVAMGRAECWIYKMKRYGDGGGTATHLSRMDLPSPNRTRKNGRDGKFCVMCLLPQFKKMPEKGKVLAGRVGILRTLEGECEVVTSPSPAPSPRTHALLESKRKPCIRGGGSTSCRRDVGNSLGRRSLVLGPAGPWTPAEG